MSNEQPPPRPKSSTRRVRRAQRDRPRRSRPPWESAGRTRPVRTRAFGLDVELGFEVRGLRPRAHTGLRPPTVIELATVDQLRSDWRASEAVCCRKVRWSGGRTAMSIDRHDELGYRVWASGLGTYLVASDGRRVRCAPPRAPDWHWQLLLLSQVFPLAATLQGLELLHASAVTKKGGAVGLVGPSGAGKTTLAAHLVLRGASFLADDGLALEPHAGTLEAHPGASLAYIHDDAVDLLANGNRARLGQVLGRISKTHLTIDRAAEARPLRVLYFLARGNTRECAFEAISNPDLGLLLGSSFNFYVRTPERLAVQLDVCACAARTVKMFRAVCPQTLPPSAVAEALDRHVTGVLEESA